MKEGAPKFESAKKEEGREVAYYKPERNPKTGKISRMKAYDADDNEIPENPSRRRFLKRTAAGAGEALTGATVLGIGAPSFWKALNEKKSQDDASPAEDEQEKEIEYEKEPEPLMPHEQLARGEAVDLVAGVEAVFEEHRAHLLDSKRGNADMEQSAENIQALDMERFVKPFIARGLPYKLAYMIAIQETRGRNLRSHSGAGSVTGIMPYTAERYGYTIEELKADPAKAAEVTAQYLADERRERFGIPLNDEAEQYDDNNIDMLLHAYNGGGGLFEFTASVPREERTPENFYKHMEEKINTEYKEIMSNGYYVYEFDTRAQNLSDVSELFEIALKDIQKANPGLDPSEMQYGDAIKIPIKNATPGTWRQVFGKEFETLYYVPELKAKYAALKAKGLVAKIEAPLGDLRIASSN